MHSQETRPPQQTDARLGRRFRCRPRTLRRRLRGLREIETGKLRFTSDRWRIVQAARHHLPIAVVKGGDIGCDLVGGHLALRAAKADRAAFGGAPTEHAE
jgi:hypothetical protein